jgi:alkanesulfonate monooxygenase SsuD/methylene tetrahydromethanopterin reductase-like flavin-dependent oxidoreductase (luciferase family)
VIELGVTIPSGDDSSRERMARVADLARQLGYQHVWAGVHLIPYRATADRGKSLDPFVPLA